MDFWKYFLAGFVGHTTASLFTWWSRRSYNRALEAAEKISRELDEEDTEFFDPDELRARLRKLRK